MSLSIRVNCLSSTTLIKSVFKLHRSDVYDKSNLGHSANNRKANSVTRRGSEYPNLKVVSGVYPQLF